MSRKSIDMSPSRRFLMASGAIMGAAAMTLSGCAPSADKAPTPAATATQTGEVTPTPDTPPATPDFQPGATGEFSPEELSRLDEASLVDLLRHRGSSQEELAENAEAALVAFLMSGTTEEELAPYVEQGLDFNTVDAFVRDMDVKYNHATCVAWGGYDESSDCYVVKEYRTLHKIILDAFAMNRLTGMLYPDFQLGDTKILTTEVTEGEFGDAKFTQKVERQGTSNYKESVMAWLAEGDGAEYYGSVQIWMDKNTVTDHYVTQDDYFTSRLTK